MGGGGRNRIEEGSERKRQRRGKTNEKGWGKKEIRGKGRKEEGRGGKTYKNRRVRMR